MSNKAKAAHQGMFPPRAWIYWFSGWKPFYSGSDEWGRHTIVLGIPWLVSLVLATKRCHCGELDGFECTFPVCPHFSMVMGGRCMTHDEDLWNDIQNEEIA